MSDPIEDIYPLSPIQLGILFQTLIAQRPEMYLEQLHLSVSGGLDVERLKAAIKAVAAVQPILRTVFDWRGGNPLQIVVRAHTPDVTYHDISTGDNEDRQRALRAFLERDAARGVDLEMGPTVRFAVLRHDKYVHSLIMTYHHILLDAASVPLILASLSRAYDASALGAAPSLQVAATYRDYVRWILSREMAPARDFWRQYLRGVDQDRQRLVVADRNSLSDIQRRTAESQDFRLPADQTQELVAISRARRLTLNSVVLGAWGASLCRTLGQAETLVGCTLSVRPAADQHLAAIAGLCVNTVPVRVRTRGRPSLLTLAGTIQRDLAEIQDFGFVALAELKRIAGSTGSGDPFQSIFVFAQQGLLPPAPHGLAWEVVGTRELTHYDLTVDAVLGADLHFKVSYPTGLVEGQVVKEVLSGAHDLLDAFRIDINRRLANPRRRTLLRSADVEATDLTPARSDSGHIAGERLIERDIAEAWSIAIGSANIGRDDDFFALGGDSLASMKATAMLIKKGYDTRVADVYTFTTPHRLSRALASRSRLLGRATPAQKDPWSISVETQRFITDLYRDNVEDMYPLTPVQRHVVAVDPASHRAGLFHEQSYIEYAEGIDPAALQHAWDHAVAVNPTLRTVYVRRGQEYVQVVLKSAPMWVAVYDIRERDEVSQQLAIASYLADDRERPFHLEQSPLLRLALFQLSPKRSGVLLSFHVTAMDGWCFASVMKDVVDAYTAYNRGSELQAKQAGPTYKEYVRWVFTQDHEQAYAFWRGYLAGADTSPAIPRHPVHRVRGPERLSDVEEIATNVLIGRLAQCRTFARRWGVTVNTVVQAAWALTLLEVGGADDIVFGATVSGRPADIAGGDSIVGLLFNDVPVRVTRPTPNVSFGVFAQAIQSNFAQLRRHEFLPPHDIRQALSPEPEGDLFQTLLVFENYPKTAEEEIRQRTHGPLTEVRAWRRDISEVDLTCYVDPLDESLCVRICYLPNRLDRRDVERVADVFATKLADGIQSGTT